MPVKRSLLFVALFCAALSAELAHADAWSLFQNLIRRGPLEIQVPAGPLADQCRAAARNLAARTGLEAVVLETGDSPDPNRPRVVFGSFETPGIEPLLDALELTRREGGGFLYNNRGYGLAGDSLVAWFEDPERPGLPVALYFSENVDDLLPYITDLMPPSRPSVICYHAGDVIFEGQLRANGEPVAGSETSSWLAASNYLTNNPFIWKTKCKSVLPPGIDENRQAEYLAGVGIARARAERLLGTKDGTLGVRLYFHTHLEDFVKLTHSNALSVANFFRPGAQILLAPGVPDDGGAAAIEAYAQKLLGPPADDWVREGLSVSAANSWWGRGLDDQIASLAYAGIAPTPAELIDPAADLNFSEHMRAPLRALLFQIAVLDADETRGADLWTGERPLVIDDEFRASYAARLTAAANDFTPPDKTIELDRYRAGFVLEEEQGVEHRSRSGNSGYGSRRSDEVIDELYGMGANSIVLSTRAFMEDEWPSRPDAPLVHRRTATSSDAALASAIAKAKQRSMRVVLQPHLATGPNGIFSGRKSWSGEESIERMFREYERFVEHYALLADLLGCEILCLGSSIKDAMDFVPDPRRKKVNLEAFQAKRDRWISIFDRARKCFRGGLTYVSRTGHRKFALKSFVLWEHFDFVSAELFQPIQGAGWVRPNDQSSIEKQIRSMMEFAESVDRPLLILPVGFPATELAAFNPSEPGYSAKDAVMGRQATLYGALSKVLAEVREDTVLAGTYLWSISTNPLRRGLSDPGFTPLGKQAEKWLPAIFGR